MKYVCGRERQRETDTAHGEKHKGMWKKQEKCLMIIQVVCCLPVCGNILRNRRLCVCVYTVALTLFCHAPVNQKLIKYPFRGGGLGGVPLDLGLHECVCVWCHSEVSFCLIPALERGHRCKEDAPTKLWGMICLGWYWPLIKNLYYPGISS